MTIEQWDGMTQEEKNEACAKTEGWTPLWAACDDWGRHWKRYQLNQPVRNHDDMEQDICPVCNVSVVRFKPGRNPLAKKDGGTE